MSLLRVFIAALVAAVAVTPAASAGVRLIMREQPVDASISSAPKAPARFNMVGLHWQGSGSLSFRTRALDGVWSVWQAARPEAEDLPDSDSSEALRAGRWKLGNPYWTGPADAIQYRVDGEATRLRAFFILSPLEPSRAPATIDRAAAPAILSRAQWGADETIVRAPAYYAQRLRFAVVHHTAGTNSYSAGESAAIVRGIQRYHVLANGWNDIGYNFLVDKYGQVFEGRGGGTDRNVVGAHAEGFNTGSTGVAVLGTYSSARAPWAARSALVRLLAWRLDIAHVDPESRLTWISGGNPKYPSGTAVRLRALSGHRDTGPTTCPGTGLYGQLAGIASAVGARGLPKLFDPEVGGSLGGPVRITGRLSNALPWSVTVRDGDGAAVAAGSGSGTSVDWTWDASEVPFGFFTYKIEAGPDVRPWTGVIPGPPPLAVKGLSALPPIVHRDKAGAIRPTRLDFRLTTAADAVVDVVDESGDRVRRLLDDGRPAGTTRIFWNGRDGSGALVPSGRYSVRVSATSPGQSDSSEEWVRVDWTLRYFELGPRPISPNGDGRRDTIAGTFELTRPADVRLRVRKGATGVVTFASASLGVGTHSYAWTGVDREGVGVPDGRYTIRVEATTDLGTRSLARDVTLDTKDPAVRILSARRGAGTRVVVFVSEEAQLTVRFGWKGEAVTRDVPSGESVVVYPHSVRRVWAFAWDPAENRSTTDDVRAR
jgi:flagellar hook assembly protein FlgD